MIQSYINIYLFNLLKSKSVVLIFFFFTIKYFLTRSQMWEILDDSKFNEWRYHTVPFILLTIKTLFIHSHICKKKFGTGTFNWGFLTVPVPSILLYFYWKFVSFICLYELPYYGSLCIVVNIIYCRTIRYYIYYVT